MTIFFRKLANHKKVNTEDWMLIVEDAFYKPNEISETIKERWVNWFKSNCFLIYWHFSKNLIF